MGVVKTIVHGGQTGVDRGAADAGTALELCVTGGAPKEFAAEDGRIPLKYQEQMYDTGFGYRERTIHNVNKVDAVLVLYKGTLSGGSRLSAKTAHEQGIAVMALDPAERGFEFSSGVIRGWVFALRPNTLMVAGPRASNWTEGQAVAEQILLRALSPARNLHGRRVQ